jgi:membrane-bound lytic murein transglycosylase D
MIFLPRQQISWLPLLVIAAIAPSAHTPVLQQSNTPLLPANGSQVGDANIHDHLQWSPAVPMAKLPERRMVVDTAADRLWTQLRDGFALPAGRSGPVQAQLARFEQDPGNVERILDRGRPYLYHILNEINRRGLPTELVLLPAVESAFDPLAYSPRGAAGLWQFMPRTAGDLGLRRDAWYDGRRDVIAATDAALDYLTQLQRRFDGDWLLALAAYNAGPARVQRAIRHNRNNGKPVDFWHLQLPRETRDYVPKLLALRSLITTPAAYGITLPTVADMPYFAVLDSGGVLDLAVAARLAGVTVAEMQRLNPAFTRQTVRRDGPNRLLIPAGQAARFGTKLAALAETQRVHWVRHQIRSGDTLSAIAHRYRITVTRLQDFNELPNSRIVAGDLLIVPVTKGWLKKAAHHPSAQVIVPADDTRPWICWILERSIAPVG